jgi:hypothetical protein
MDESTRNDVMQMGWKIHGVVEESYRSHPATRDDESGWLDKRRLLLADMAVHLLQTSLQPGSIALDKLANNLHAILTVSDQFLPHADLKKAAVKIVGKHAPLMPAE